MKFIFTILYIFISFLFSQNTIVHINSTYFDGTPKEIIIYEYSNLYKNKPLKILDTLSFDKYGNLLYDYNNYFNDNWFCDKIGSVQIINNKFRVLDNSSCIGCYAYMDNWEIITTNNELYVNLNSSIFLDKESQDQNSNYNFSIEIKSLNNFILKLGSFEYNFIRS
tara:strand:- start:1216 stop:1713 length:498 start_codon:yes stop_codon:yes gene_type:complete